MHFSNVADLVHSKKINFLLDFESALEGSGIHSSATRLAKNLTKQGYTVKLNSHEPSAIVHAHTALPISFIKAKLIKKNRKSYYPLLIVHGHTTIEDFVNSFIFSNHIKFFLRYYLPMYYKSFDHIIAVSKHNKHLLMNYDIPEEKITVISNGIMINSSNVNSKIREKTRNYLGLAATDKLIICIGVCIYRKGVDTFIDIAQKLPEYRFIWIGKRVLTSHSSYLKGKFKLAKKLSNCQFPGYVSHKTLIGLLNAADLFLYPTREENQGISFLEATLYNKPAVISDHPVFEEYIDKKHVLKATTVDDFVEKIKLVLTNEVLAKELVSNSKNYLEVHNITHSVEKITQLYNNLLRSKS